MSGCTSATVPARNAVPAPTQATTVMASPLTSKKACARATRKTPAVTMVAAWIRAETGVGPSIASGSQKCSGNCALLPTAPKKRSRAIAVAVPESSRSAPGERAVGTGVVQRSELGEDQEHRDHEADVADAGGDERLLARVRRRVALVPERDQQVGAEPDALPPEEGHEEAAAQHQDQHGGDEQVHVGEEPREARVAVHVADRIDVDQRRDAGDEEDERDRQRVGEEPELDLQPTRRQPGEEVDDVLPVLGAEVAQREEHHDRREEREAEHQAADPPRERFADALAEQQEEQRAEQRERRDEPDQIEDVARAHRAVSPSASARRRRWRRAGAGRSPR